MHFCAIHYGCHVCGSVFLTVDQLRVHPECAGISEYSAQRLASHTALLDGGKEEEAVRFLCVFCSPGMKFFVCFLGLAQGNILLVFRCERSTFRCSSPSCISRVRIVDSVCRSDRGLIWMPSVPERLRSSWSNGSFCSRHWSVFIFWSGFPRFFLFTGSHIMGVHSVHWKHSNIDIDESVLVDKFIFIDDTEIH